MTVPVKSYWQLLVSYLRPQWRPATLLGLLLATSIALRLLNPQILRSFIDSATGGAPTDRLITEAIIFIVIALLTQALAVGATYLSQSVSWTATNALRTDLVAHCLGLDLGFHKSRTSGELIERIDGDVNALSNFFSQFVVDLLSNAVLLVGVLLLLFREHWLIGATMSAFALLALLLMGRVREVATPYWVAVRDHSATFFGFVGEQLAGTIDIRSNGATSYVMRCFYELIRAWLPIVRKAALAGYTMWMITITAVSISVVLTFGVSAYLWSRGLLTLGSAYLVFYYTQLLNTPIQSIRTQLQDLQQAGASIERIQSLFAVRSQLEDHGTLSLPQAALAVEFDDVTFAYADDEPILRHVSFHLPAGRVLGLLGRTGSGKTTLARLLMRLYDPASGAVRLGGTNARAVPLADLRRAVGMVTQDVQLFQASVRDNLALFNPEIDDGQIEHALDELGLSEWVRALPRGLDTQLGPGGQGLSAGEAQLLAFTRVLLKDPGLVILDEASSRLDPATERLLERAIDRLLRPEGAHRTGIIIAHRLRTVQRAGAIMILDHGHIAEYGRQNELRADPHSRFYSLLQTGLEEALA